MNGERRPARNRSCWKSECPHQEEERLPMPLIAIIDWDASPQDDSESTIERRVIAGAAQVKRFLCSGDADFNDEICGADAMIVWHNAPITAAGLAKLRNCKVLVRNGVGFDSV